MNRYIVLTEEKCCGHKHTHYGRALDCLDRFEDHGIPAMIAAIPKKNRRVDPLWIEYCLLKHTSMREMAEALQG